MSASTPIARLQQRLTDAFKPIELRIDDFSAQHAGHAGAKHGGHYRVFIVAEAFAGRPLVARHRMVYEAVAQNLQRDVHALSIVAKAPAEVPQTKAAAQNEAEDPAGNAEDAADDD